jgi:hypothetical protein
MLDTLAVVFIVIHQVVHLPLVLVEANRGVVGLADVPFRAKVVRMVRSLTCRRCSTSWMMDYR